MDSRLKKNSTRLVVLAALNRRPMHGYAITEYLQATLPDSLKFGAGMLYPLLHSLEQQKLIIGKWEEFAGMKRRVYSLTKKGKKEFTAQTKEWQTMNALIGRLVLNFSI